MNEEGAATAQTALWAMQRWGVVRARVVGAPAVAALLREAGLDVTEAPLGNGQAPHIIPEAGAAREG
ncbi:MAG: hypothetical protein NVV62_10255 [Terricaulis sp.]|nr:hypothetical protein [Terricaulis sp.]